MANVVGYFLGLFTAAALLISYVRLVKSKKKFGMPEYIYIMVVLSGCAVWLVLIFTFGDK
ncbi:hypothetical protein [Actinoplanes sp. NPDC026619]|uniref:hypothetical protein n=1 Tax=Actinoplanes sp. NPDC026619 TaxID=3155798 RepID=UPI0033F38F10